MVQTLGIYMPLTKFLYLSPFAHTIDVSRVNIRICKDKERYPWFLSRVCAKVPDRMCETKFFTILLIFYYFDFSPLLEFIIFIAILCHLYQYTKASTLTPGIVTMASCIVTLIPNIFCIPTQI